MGKKKIDNLQYLQDKHLRNIAFTFRKRGLLKKCIEISSMCGLDVYLLIRDKHQNKTVEFQSSD
jgi:hypothetical protein